MIPYIGRAQGGPVVSLSVLAQAQAAAGHRVRVICAPCDADGPEMPFGTGVEVIRARPRGRGTFRWCPDLDRVFDRVKCDVLHSHGLWTDVHRRASLWAGRRRIPHVVAPCGMLDAGALFRSRWKKVPAWFLFQRGALRCAALVQAKSEHEVRDIRAAGLRGRVVLIPNPVAPPPAGAWTGDQFRAAFGLEDGRRIVLYLGRIHPVKGVAELARVWCGLTRYHAAWRLVIAGPDEGGHRAEVEAILRVGECEGTVSFTGMLSDELKWGAYAAADLFVMPSRWENFGVSVAEALQAGAPVLTTAGTPWGRLNELNAGWCVAPAEESIRMALARALVMPRDELRTMQANSRSMSAAYEPRRVADELEAAYREHMRHAEGRAGC